MAANASWAPANQSHLLRSSSTITHVAYSRGRVEYSLFDSGTPYASEKLSLGFVPRRVLVGEPGDEEQALRPLPRLADGFGAPWHTGGGGAAAAEGRGEPSFFGWSFGGESGREARIRHRGRRVVVVA